MITTAVKDGRYEDAHARARALSELDNFLLLFPNAFSVCRTPCSFQLVELRRHR